MFRRRRKKSQVAIAAANDELEEWGKKAIREMLHGPDPPASAVDGSQAGSDVSGTSSLWSNWTGTTLSSSTYASSYDYYPPGKKPWEALERQFTWDGKVFFKTQSELAAAAERYNQMQLRAMVLQRQIESEIHAALLDEIIKYYLRGFCLAAIREFKPTDAKGRSLKQRACLGFPAGNDTFYPLGDVKTAEVANARDMSLIHAELYEGNFEKAVFSTEPYSREELHRDRSTDAHAARRARLKEEHQTWHAYNLAFEKGLIPGEHILDQIIRKYRPVSRGSDASGGSGKGRRPPPPALAAAAVGPPRFAAGLAAAHSFSQPAAAGQLSPRGAGQISRTRRTPS